jgi:hypothetical protein
MRLGRKKPAPPKILSRVQDTSRAGRGFSNVGAVDPRQQAVARAGNLEVYDSVEAANQAGLPMPGTF